MKLLTLSSKFYSSLSFPVPDVPGAPEGTAGEYTFANGQRHEVTDRTALAVQGHYDAFPDRVKSRITLLIEGDEPEAAPAAAVVAPAAAPSKRGKKAAPVPEEAPPPPVVVTEEDKELIEAEIEKLMGKTIAQGEVLLVGVATNEDLPLPVRRAYLEAVVDHEQVQKGLKDRALELAEEIG